MTTGNWRKSGNGEYVNPERPGYSIRKMSSSRWELRLNGQLLGAPRTLKDARIIAGADHAARRMFPEQWK
jgi:hypothetical protein